MDEVFIWSEWSEGDLSRRLRDVWRHERRVATRHTRRSGTRGGDGLTVCPKQLPLPPASELSPYYQLVNVTFGRTQPKSRATLCLVSGCTKPISHLEGFEMVTLYVY